MIGTTEPLLQVSGLHTHFFSKTGRIKAVDDVSFTVARGEVLGLVGESGSGKSMTAYSIMGLVDPPGQIVAHHRVSRSAARSRSREALVKVGIPSPDERLEAYPHQFSGGMRQRVAIAIALLNNPDLIIADEPTTALDVTIQGQILFEMQKLTRETGAALIWITHDLSVIAGLADRIYVMYAGRIVEQGTTADVLTHPRHPYTRGLLDSVPANAPARERLRQIPGMTPSLLELPPGCAFRSRCQYADDACERTPMMRPLGGDGQMARCFHPLMAVNE